MSCGQIVDALARGGVVEAGRDHQELVAAVANDMIVGPERFPERVRKQLETGVAGRMAVHVVDLLEAVEIEEQQHRARRLDVVEDVAQRAPIDRPRSARSRSASRRRFSCADDQLADSRPRAARRPRSETASTRAEHEQPLRAGVERRARRDERAGERRSSRPAARPTAASMKDVRGRFRQGQQCRGARSPRSATSIHQLRDRNNTTANVDQRHAHQRMLRDADRR